MDKLKEKIGLIGLFVISFFVFLYLSFPYGVLKEAVSAQVQLATGMSVRIDELGPAFPFGLKGKGVQLLGAQRSRVSFDSVSVTLSVWQLAIMRVGVNIDMTSGPKGELTASLGFPIVGFFKKNGFIPAVVRVSAKSFPMGDLVSYGLKLAASSGVGGTVAAPVLSGIGLKGDLNGGVNLDIDAASLSQSSGDVSLSFAGAVLVLSDAAIGVPDQKLETAAIKASMAGGILKIDSATKLASSELELAAEGKVSVKNVVDASDLDLKTTVKLQGSLAEGYGWFMDAISGGEAKDGVLVKQIRGTLASPTTSSL